MTALPALQFITRFSPARGLSVCPLSAYAVLLVAQGRLPTQSFADAGIACPNSSRPAADPEPIMIGGRVGAAPRVRSSRSLGQGRVQCRTHLGNGENGAVAQSNNRCRGSIDFRLTGPKPRIRGERVVSSTEMGNCPGQHVGLPRVERHTGRFEFIKASTELVRHSGCGPGHRLSLGFHPPFIANEAWGLLAFQRIRKQYLALGRLSGLREQSGKLQTNVCHRCPFTGSHACFLARQRSPTRAERCFLGRQVVSRAEVGDCDGEHLDLGAIRSPSDSLGMLEGVLNLLGDGEERRPLIANHVRS